MTEFNDDVLEGTVEIKTVPQVVKTLAILSYVGNGLWTLLLLIMAFALNAFMGELVNRLDAPTMSTDQLMTLIMIGCLVLAVFCILSIVGAAMMTKGKKSGFVLYAIGNGIWTLLMIMGGTPQGIVFGVISLGFILGFGMQLKNFPS